MPIAIWITEVWDTKENHSASLTLPSVQASIAKGRHMITGFGERFETEPLGGHGLSSEKRDIIPTVDGFKLQADRTVWTMGFDFEEQARSEGYRLIAGVDEVGRGCLAGPVVAAACILDPEKPVPKGLNDSKKLTGKRRDEIAAELREYALAFAIGAVEADEIDTINILEATKKAMLIAIAALQPSADYLLIDALRTS